VLGLQQVCPNLLTFWQAWPIAIIVSAITGMMLGVPVLRLRGDYLAIVTLGFGEILQRILISSTFKPVFGGPQGVGRIPVPIIGDIELDQAVEVYYLFLLVVGLGAVIIIRLASSKVGRSWRALRDDEDVAEAMGINTTVAKLLAFGVSSAFSGMGGALFGASLQGIFPNSFTLLVSINVLSLVILGGIGGIAGVFIGAFVLVGMPEILRELRDYRLLAFGVLLVVTMLLRPEGLLPPAPPKLSEQSTAYRNAEAAGD
jgi:branched-chain amino acid transport system permease protein